MAFKTYAGLTAASDVQDGDLLASYRGTGPLRSLTALILKTYLQSTAIPTAQTISVNTATTAADYFILKPTDYGTGKPGLFFSKEAGATNWRLQLYDGATVAGQLDVNLTLLNLTGALDVSGTLTASGGFAATTGSFTELLSTAPSTTAGAGLNIAEGAAPTTAADGDVWMTASGLFARAGGLTAGPFGAPQIIEVQNRQPQNNGNPEDSAGWTVATWNPRVLNTVVFNTIAGASLASNQITLPAGSYLIQVTGTGLTQINTLTNGAHRLFDYTASSLLVVQNITVESGSNFSVSTTFSGTFTLAGSHAVGVDMRYASGGFNHFGIPANISGVPEVYTDVIITKIG